APHSSTSSVRRHLSHSSPCFSPSFFLSPYPNPLDLHSFPTRRSSDLPNHPAPRSHPPEPSAPRPAQCLTLSGVSALNAGPSFKAHFSPRSRTVIVRLRHSQSTFPSRVESPLTLIANSSQSSGIPAPITSEGSSPDSSRKASMSNCRRSISAAVQ